MSQTPARRRGALLLPILGAIVCGLGVATQTRINGALGAALEHGLLAAVISFGSGLIIVLVVAALAPSARQGMRRLIGEIRGGRTPWWYVLGGTGGAMLVFSQGIVAGVLGVALFSIGVVAGQTLSGTLIDRHGFGTMRPRRITAARVVGAVLALVAVVIAGAGQVTGTAPVWLLVFPFVAGLMIAWQQAANGQVRDISRSVIVATTVNFIVGTTVLVVGALATLAWTGWPATFPTNPLLYLGGVVGVVFIALGSLVVRSTGVLVLTLGTIAGQLLGSLVLDVIVPAEGHALGVTTVIGVAVILIGVILASRSGATPASRAPGQSTET
jgi:transporter family-2 protein